MTPLIMELFHGGFRNVKMCGVQELVVGRNVMDVNRRVLV